MVNRASSPLSYSHWLFIKPDPTVHVSRLAMGERGWSRAAGLGRAAGDQELREPDDVLSDVTVAGTLRPLVTPEG